MQSYQFLIRARAPLAINTPELRVPTGPTGKVFIPGVSIKGHMRSQLRASADPDKLPSSHELPLFGSLEEPGRMLIRDAQAVKISNEHRYFTSSQGQIISEQELIGSESLFEGTIGFDGGNPLHEITGLLCLLSVNRLGGGMRQGFGSCSISLDPTHIGISKIFECGKVTAKVPWPVLIRQRALAYFGDWPDALYKLKPREFEMTIAEIFRLEGFDVVLTPETRDGGYDVLAVRHRENTGNEFVLVECKRYANHRKVGIDIVRQLVGVVAIENATRGIIVTTSSFSGPAIKTARRIGLTLYDLSTLTQWIEDICSN